MWMFSHFSIWHIILLHFLLAQTQAFIFANLMVWWHYATLFNRYYFFKHSDYIHTFNHPSPFAKARRLAMFFYRDFWFIGVAPHWVQNHPFFEGLVAVRFSFSFAFIFRSFNTYITVFIHS
jgi:hypothetical protein